MDAADLAACENAVAAVSAAADLADQKAAESDGFFARTIMGAGSTIDAMKADAYATRNGFTVLRAKLDGFEARGDGSHADAVDIIRSAGAFADVSQLLAAAQSVDVGHVAAGVAADTAHQALTDVAAGATAGVGIYLTVAALGLGGFFVFKAMK